VAKVIPIIKNPKKTEVSDGALIKSNAKVRIQAVAKIKMGMQAINKNFFISIPFWARY